MPFSVIRTVRPRGPALKSERCTARQLTRVAAPRTVWAAASPPSNRAADPTKPRAKRLATTAKASSDRSTPGVEITDKEAHEGAGGGSGGPGDSGGDGGDGDNGGGHSGDSGGSLDPVIGAALLAAGRTVDSFPKDFASALLAGKVTLPVLERYLAMEKDFFLRFVWGSQGMRERLLADPSFPVKMGIECGIGIFTKVTAEKAKREDNFAKEIDFVAANVLMAIFADFMLTWLPAPTMAFTRRPQSGSLFSKMFAGCPDNAFQKVYAGAAPYSIVQRAGAVVRNGAKLLMVGTAASVFGVGLTNGLAAVRTAMDPEWHAPNGPQDLVKTSVLYGVYMSVSSNLRYQLVAGVIEERGIETVFRGKPGVCHALSFVVRTLNTFWGSLLWVDFVRLCGMQKAPEQKATA